LLVVFTALSATFVEDPSFDMDAVFVVLERAGGSFGMSPMRAIRLAEAVVMKASGHIASAGSPSSRTHPSELLLPMKQR
jgi:hypothetical protein